MEDKQGEKKAYTKPEVRRVKLSLAELTLGTNCDTTNQTVASPGCTDAIPACSN